MILSINARIKSARVTWSLAALLTLLSASAFAQTWKWSYEDVDNVPAKFTSIAVDKNGSLHVAYSSEEIGLKYAFRPAGESRWYSMTIGGGSGFTSIALDAGNNPHICHSPRELWYLRYKDSKWLTQQI